MLSRNIYGSKRAAPCANAKREMAQDAIIASAVNAALIAREGGFTDVADEIEKEATRLAKRYGLSDVPGLPKSFEKR